MKKIFYLSIMLIAMIYSSEENPKTEEGEKLIIDQNQDKLEGSESLSERLKGSENNDPNLLEVLKEEIIVFCGSNETAREKELLEKFKKLSPEDRQNRLGLCLSLQLEKFKKLSPKDRQNRLGLCLSLQNILNYNYNITPIKDIEYSDEKANDRMIACLRAVNVLHEMERENFEEHQKRMAIVTKNFEEHQKRMAIVTKNFEEHQKRMIFVCDIPDFSIEEEIEVKEE